MKTPSQKSWLCQLRARSMMIATDDAATLHIFRMIFTADITGH